MQEEEGEENYFLKAKKLFGGDSFQAGKQILKCIVRTIFCKRNNNLTNHFFRKKHSKIAFIYEYHLHTPTVTNMTEAAK